jgi:malate dehydrogenase (quinone)
MEKTVVIWTFCWFSTRFLKMVPILIALSIKPDNIIPMIAAGIKNIPY